MRHRDFKKLAKILSQLEEGPPKSLKLLKGPYKDRSGVPTLGITGLPGAGKSTLADQLIELLRAEGKIVAVLAMDPSSPFSGGALLGDRVRMQRHAADGGVFIRSVGSRGAHGGLSRAAHDLTVCLDAYGFDEIIIETVGVGQTELDIMGLATTTVVVLVPEAGDTIQTIKAGLTEIADIFVVNKADREGALGMQTMLYAMIRMDNKARHWSPPVLLTQADKGGGVEELWQAILKHREALQKNPEHEKRSQQMRRNQFLGMCEEAAAKWLKEKLEKESKWKGLLEQVAADQLNPYEALKKVLTSLS